MWKGFLAGLVVVVCLAALAGCGCHCKEEAAKAAAAKKKAEEAKKPLAKITDLKSGTPETKPAGTP